MYVNNIDRSLEKIDFMKLLFFLIIFLVVTFSLIFILIIPNIKEHRLQKTEYKRVLVHKTRVENLFLERELELNRLKSENTNILLAFHHAFTQEEFIAYAQKFFTEVHLAKISEGEYQKEFQEYELNVTSALKAPSNFYAFLEGLNKYSNIIQADFPIHLESMGKENISSRFTVKVYDINATR